MESLDSLEHNLRELLNRYEAQQQQITALQEENRRQREEIIRTHAELVKLKSDYNHLHTAHALVANDVDDEERARARHQPDCPSGQGYRGTETVTEQRKQHITLQLDAHHISLNVPADAEELYRRACDMLNDRYRFYQRKMPLQSAEQVWVYVALEMAVNLHADAHAHRLEPVDEKLQELNQLIINTLNK